MFFGHCHCTRFRDSFCLASVFEMTVYLLTYALGNRKGIQPATKLDVGLLVVTISLELCTSYSSSCHFHYAIA